MSALRIFLTTSHISSVYMTLYARETVSPNSKDVLLIDAGRRTPEVVALIRSAASLHTWTAIHDLSDHVLSGRGFKPSLRKRLTRRWKEAPVINLLYRSLLRRYSMKQDAELEERLRNALSPVSVQQGEVALFAHTQTRTTDPLQKLFPQSSLSFFEHGLGDYLYAVDGGQLPVPTHVLFADGFRRYLDRRGIPSDHVLPLTLPIPFERLAKDLLKLAAVPTRATLPGDVGKPIIYVLLEAVDMYEVSSPFWGAYIDHIVGNVPDPHRYHFLLKPHPMASATSLAATEKRCRELTLSYSMLDTDWEKSVAAEVMFAQYSDRVERVYCLFSSACFYLSKLYPAQHISYYYSTAFMDRWTGNAPPMYVRHFEGLKPLISEVFAERCTSY